MTMEAEPLGGSERYFVVWGEAVPVFDDMHVLHPEAFARTHHRAGVVGLVEVFNNDAEPIGARGEDALDLFPPRFGDKGLEECSQACFFMGSSHVGSEDARRVRSAKIKALKPVAVPDVFPPDTCLR